MSFGPLVHVCIPPLSLCDWRSIAQSYELTSYFQTIGEPMNVCAAMSSSVSNASPAQTPSTSESSTSQSSAAYLWDVSEILAERTTLSGDIELLIVFKTQWVPKGHLFDDCPAMQRYNQAGKYTFVSAAGAVTVLVPPGSSLAQDVDHATAESERSANSAVDSCALQSPHSPTFVDVELVVEGAAPNPKQPRISRYLH